MRRNCAPFPARSRVRIEQRAPGDRARVGGTDGSDRSRLPRTVRPLAVLARDRRKRRLPEPCGYHLAGGVGSGRGDHRASLDLAPVPPPATALPDHPRRRQGRGPRPSSMAAKPPETPRSAVRFLWRPAQSDPAPPGRAPPQSAEWRGLPRRGDALPLDQVRGDAPVPVFSSAAALRFRRRTA